MSLFCCCASRQTRIEPSALPEALPLSSVGEGPDTYMRQPNEDHEQGTLVIVAPRPSSRQTTVSKSPSMMQASAVQVEHLHAKDSDSEESDFQYLSTGRKVVDNVRMKMLRYLSHDARMKRQAHTSVGNTEGEVARRAELKRLRHKRIEEELKNEKSKEQDQSAPESARQSSSPTRLSPAQPIVGPRDIIEFAVLDEGEVVASTTSDEVELVDPGQRYAREQQIVPPLSGPQSANPQARRVSSPTSVTSPTLSTSNEQPPLAREEHNESKNTEATVICEDQSGPAPWLTLEAQNPGESSIALQQDREMKKAFNEAPPTGLLTSGGRQGNRMYEEAATTASNEAKSTLDFPLDSQSSASQDEKHSARKNKSLPLLMQLVQSPSEDLAESFAVAMAYNTQMAKDDGSSTYNSAIPSLQVSPARSQTNLPVLTIRHLQDMQLNPFQSKHPQLKSGDASLLVQERLCQTDQKHGESVLAVPQQTGPQSAPSDASATISPQHGEGELRPTQRRFGDALSRKRLWRPLDSRFKQGVAQPSAPMHNGNSTKDNIYLTVPRPRRKITGSTGLETGGGSASQKSYQSRTERPSSWSRSSNNEGSSLYLQSELNGSATNLWERAIRLEAEQRRSGQHSSRPQGSESSRLNPRWNTRPNSSQSIQGIELTTMRTGSGPLAKPRSHGQCQVVSTDQTSRTAIQHSEIPQSASPQIATASWAKYPSHTRDERNRLATSHDNITQRDFAVLGLAGNSLVRWSTDKVSGLDDTADRSKTRGRIGKAVKAKITGLFSGNHISNKAEYNHEMMRDYRNDQRIVAEAEFQILSARATGQFEHDSSNSYEFSDAAEPALTSGIASFTSPLIRCLAISASETNPREHCRITKTVSLPDLVFRKTYIGRTIMLVPVSWDVSRVGCAELNIAGYESWPGARLSLA